MTIEAKIELATLAISSLVPWPKNPRRNHAVDEITRSMEAFGYLAPIVVQRGTNRILAGHGRLEALRTAGVKEIPCIVADVTDDQADLYTVADNKITELAEWDDGALAELVRDLDARGLDVNLTGFSAEELDEIAAWMPPGPPEDFREVNEGIETEHSCPKCGYKWSGGK